MEDDDQRHTQDTNNNDIGEGEGQTDRDEDVDMSTNTNSDSNANDLTSYITNADEQDADDAINNDFRDSKEARDVTVFHRAESDVISKDEFQGDDDPTSQDDDIIEGELPSDVPSASTAQASATDIGPQYSTRGRHHHHHSRESDTDVHLRDKALTATADAPDEVERPVGASFLDSLGEEERRTRTRFLPNVDGFHALHKAQVKQDLQLARTHMSTNGVASKLNATRSQQNKNYRRDEDNPEKKTEDEMHGSTSEEEQTHPDTVAAFTVSTGMADPTPVIPSRAFVVPLEEETESSPHIVETVTAFNPPLLPESVGPKKKHRMMRWELNPLAVGADLKTYRKTVARTRKELIEAQAEQERMEAVSAHLRAHFLGHCKALEQEGSMLNNEFAAVQVDCVKAADLLQSRTRSRGVGKGSFVMKDVLHVLKQRGAETSHFPADRPPHDQNQVVVGVGGLPDTSFKDWARFNEIEPTKYASAWTLPGQTVQTPYGNGKVIHVFEPALLNVSEPPLAISVNDAPTLKSANHGFGSSDFPPSSTNRANKVGVATKGPEKKNLQTNQSIDKMGTKQEERLHDYNVGGFIAARVCVKLPFGIGFFTLKAVSCYDNVSNHSDAMLVSRWRHTLDTAMSVAGSIDPSSMTNIVVASTATSKETKIASTEELVSDESAKETFYEAIPTNVPVSSLLPHGADLLPTSAGRAVRLAKIPIPALEHELNSSLLNSCAMLGKIDNPGVPSKFREWEDIRDELSLVRAQVLQRRNELARQRRLRLMNERALITTTDKSIRVENLVAEMRADLKSLKDRLDYELIELGIDADRAGRLLSAHYNDSDCKSDYHSSNHNHYRDAMEMEHGHSQQQSRKRLASTTSSLSRRRGDGLSEDDVDDTRPSAKRTRPSSQ